MSAWIDLDGNVASGILLIADHASARVPEGVALGVPAETMREHVAVDIGVAPLAAALCERLGMPAVLGNVSRLVIDLNREEGSAGLIPEVSDGRTIPGNMSLTPAARAARIDRWWRPYHAHLARRIARTSPGLLISLHSFTPRLATSSEPRPWRIGILYNRDARAARIALPLLEAAGVSVGDNLPYSGTVLNATMNRHGEANDIPYLGVEVRQDLIADGPGIAHWAAILEPVLRAVMLNLSPGPVRG